MFNSIQSSISNMKNELERECDDIQMKIDQIMKTELITFDKIKDIELLGNEDDHSSLL